MIVRLVLCLLATGVALRAATLGTNPASQPLTAERIAALPAVAQAPWREYLARSTAQRAADQKFLADELKAHGLTAPVAVEQTRGSARITGSRPAAWFGSAEARALADNVVSFQTPAGGWGKNFNTADHRRKPGEPFAPGSTLSAFLTPGDHDQPRDERWSYIGTFDNDATISQLRFLARVAAAADATTGAAWRAAFLRGLGYIFAAQYPNGGWPQNYPLDGGYHDGVTFNDGAFVNILTLLREVAAGQGDYRWVPEDARQRATAAGARGLECVLACQLTVDGRRTAWCQQYDMLTLQPASARNYEMPSQSAGESAGIAVFLMQLPNPSPAVVAAVHAAAQWFEATALRDVAFTQAPDGAGRLLLPSPGNGPIWARYYDLATNRPIFGDRDKSIHDTIAEISRERRNGYSWFGNGPKRALDHYAKWSKAHPAPPR